MLVVGVFVVGLPATRAHINREGKSETRKRAHTHTAHTNTLTPTHTYTTTPPTRHRDLHSSSQLTVLRFAQRHTERPERTLVLLGNALLPLPRCSLSPHCLFVARLRCAYTALHLTTAASLATAAAAMIGHIGPVTGIRQHTHTRGCSGTECDPSAMALPFTSSVISLRNAAAIEPANGRKTRTTTRSANVKPPGTFPSKLNTKMRGAFRTRTKRRWRCVDDRTDRARGVKLEWDVQERDLIF